jgi:hypothetical protein
MMEGLCDVYHQWSFLLEVCMITRFLKQCKMLETSCNSVNLHKTQVAKNKGTFKINVLPFVTEAQKSS